jgi:hypothetical protein
VPQENGSRLTHRNRMTVLVIIYIVIANKWVKSIVGRILKPFADRFLQYELRWQRDLFLQQGLVRLIENMIDLRGQVCP